MKKHGLSLSEYSDVFVFVQQKRPESPLDPTNPFLEDEPGEDVGTEKDEDLAKVSGAWLLRSLVRFLRAWGLTCHDLSDYK